MQPSSQDPTNQSDQSKPSTTSSQFDQGYGQERHPGEEGYYGTTPQPPPIDYSTSNHSKLKDMQRQPERRNPLVAVVLVLVALVIILGATTFFALRRTGFSPISAAPTATPQAQVTPAPTAPLSATSTSMPSPAATPQVVAPLPSGTVTENILLTCGANCDDPIRVTITTVHVNDAEGNMTWNISLKNVSGSSMGYGIDTFELLPSGTQNQIKASFAQSGGTLANSDPESVQGIFSFVPTQNTTYTLTVRIRENPYMGPEINFDPVQITNL